KEGIESDPRNYTRFLVLSARHAVNEHANKTSIIFSTPNTPGALLHTLKVFSDRNINLVKLESRPIAGRPFEYIFYADLEGGLTDPTVKAAVEEVRKSADIMKVLGSYPAA
ncbi:MAG: ACT domain-containing protein, partial [Acidobacteria bacterium]|nr:ACT domain-containing protein [Acidobacteriota bacterium]